MKNLILILMTSLLLIACKEEIPYNSADIQFRSPGVADDIDLSVEQIEAKRRLNVYMPKVLAFIEAFNVPSQIPQMSLNEVCEMLVADPTMVIVYVQAYQYYNDFRLKEGELVLRQDRTVGTYLGSSDYQVYYYAQPDCAILLGMQ